LEWSIFCSSRLAVKEAQILKRKYDSAGDWGSVGHGKGGNVGISGKEEGRKRAIDE